MVTVIVVAEILRRIQPLKIKIFTDVFTLDRFPENASHMQKCRIIWKQEGRRERGWGIKVE